MSGDVVEWTSGERMRIILFSVVFILLFLLTVLMARADPYINVSNCGFNATSAVCGDTVLASCNVTDTTAAQSVNSVSLVIGGVTVNANRFGGSGKNGVYAGTLHIAPLNDGVWESVAATNSVGQTCGASILFSSPSCSVSVPVSGLSVSCACTYVTNVSACGKDNTQVVVQTPSTGCGNGAQVVSTRVACDYCSPEWVLSGSSGVVANRVVDESVNQSGIIDEVKYDRASTSTATLQYVSLNATCCVDTGLASDCTPPSSNAQPAVYTWDYWLGAQKTSDGSNTEDVNRFGSTSFTQFVASVNVSRNIDGSLMNPMVFQVFPVGSPSKSSDGKSYVIVPVLGGLNVYDEQMHLVTQSRIDAANDMGWMGQPSIVGAVSLDGRREYVNSYMLQDGAGVAGVMQNLSNGQIFFVTFQAHNVNVDVTGKKGYAFVVVLDRRIDHVNISTYNETNAAYPGARSYEFFGSYSATTCARDTCWFVDFNNRLIRVRNALNEGVPEFRVMVPNLATDVDNIGDGLLKNLAVPVLVDTNYVESNIILDLGIETYNRPEYVVYKGMSWEPNALSGLGLDNGVTPAIYVCPAFPEDGLCSAPVVNVSVTKCVGASCHCDQGNIYNGTFDFWCWLSGGITGWSVSSGASEGAYTSCQSSPSPPSCQKILLSGVDEGKISPLVSLAKGTGSNNVTTLTWTASLKNSGGDRLYSLPIDHDFVAPNIVPQVSLGSSSCVSGTVGMQCLGAAGIGFFKMNNGISSLNNSFGGKIAYNATVFFDDASSGVPSDNGWTGSFGWSYSNTSFANGFRTALSFNPSDSFPFGYTQKNMTSLHYPLSISMFAANQADASINSPSSIEFRTSGGGVVSWECPVVGGRSNWSWTDDGRVTFTSSTVECQRFGAGPVPAWTDLKVVFVNETFVNVYVNNTLIKSGPTHSSFGSTGSVLSIGINTAVVQESTTFIGNVTVSMNLTTPPGPPFLPLNQVHRDWTGVAAAPNGNVYASVSGGDIYMQSCGVGDFVALNQTHRNWEGMVAAPSGNIYAVTNTEGPFGGHVYIQYAGVGDFVRLSDSWIQNNFWQGLTIAPNGDIYGTATSDYNGDHIFLWTNGTNYFNGTTNFIELGGFGFLLGMGASPNGDVYAVQASGDIYKRSGGVGSFVPLNQGSLLRSAVAVTPNGDVYTDVNGGDIFMQTNGTGGFFSFQQSGNAWSGMSAVSNGDVYAAVSGGDIYKQTNSRSLNIPSGASVPYNISIIPPVQTREDTGLSSTGIATYSLFSSVPGQGLIIKNQDLMLNDVELDLIGVLGRRANTLNIFSTNCIGTSWSSIGTFGFDVDGVAHPGIILSNNSCYILTTYYSSGDIFNATQYSGASYPISGVYVDWQIENIPGFSSAPNGLKRINVTPANASSVFVPQFLTFSCLSGGEGNGEGEGNGSNQFVCYSSSLLPLAQGTYSGTKSVCSKQLSAADMNGDGLDDFVDQEGIFSLSKVSGPVEKLVNFSVQSTAKSHVQVVGVDADTLADVLFTNETSVVSLLSVPEQGCQKSAVVQIGSATCKASSGILSVSANGVSGPNCGALQYQYVVLQDGKPIFTTGLTATPPDIAANLRFFQVGKKGNFSVQVIVVDAIAKQSVSASCSALQISSPSTVCQSVCDCGEVACKSDVTIGGGSGGGGGTGGGGGGGGGGTGGGPSGGGTACTSSTQCAACFVCVSGVCSPNNISLVCLGPQPDGCTLGDDGEFNFLDSVTNHRWSLGGVEPGKTGTDLFFSAQGNILHGLSCADAFTVVETNQNVGLSTTMDVLLAAQSGAGTGTLGGYRVQNGVLYGVGKETVALETVPVGAYQKIVMYFKDTDGRIYFIADGILVGSVDYAVAKSGPMTSVKVDGGDCDGSPACSWKLDYVRFGRYQQSVLSTILTSANVTAYQVLNACNSSVEAGRTHDVVSAFCLKLHPGDGYCSITDLSSAVRKNSACFKEAFNYCDYVTFPMSGGFNTEAADVVTADTGGLEGTSVCWAALIFRFGIDREVLPLWKVGYNIILANVMMILVLLVVLVVLSRRK